ncbi:unnamed protein product, partial [Amoebophrya sp. A120]
KPTCELLIKLLAETEKWPLLYCGSDVAKSGHGRTPEFLPGKVSQQLCPSPGVRLKDIAMVLTSARKYRKSLSRSEKTAASAFPDTMTETSAGSALAPPTKTLQTALQIACPSLEEVCCMILSSHDRRHHVWSSSSTPALWTPADEDSKMAQQQLVSEEVPMVMDQKHHQHAV